MINAKTTAIGEPLAAGAWHFPLEQTHQIKMRCRIGDAQLQRLKHFADNVGIALYYGSELLGHFSEDLICRNIRARTMTMMCPSEDGKRRAMLVASGVKTEKRPEALLSSVTIRIPVPYLSRPLANSKPDKPVSKSRPRSSGFYRFAYRRWR